MGTKLEKQGLRIGYIFGGIFAVLGGALLTFLYLPELVSIMGGTFTLWDPNLLVNALSSLREFIPIILFVGVPGILLACYIFCLFVRISASATWLRLVLILSAFGLLLNGIVSEFEIFAQLGKYVPYVILGLAVLGLVFYILGLISRAKQKGRVHEYRASTVLVFAATFWLVFDILLTVSTFGGAVGLTGDMFEVLTLVMNISSLGLVGLFLIASGIWMFITIPRRVVAGAGSGGSDKKKVKRPHVMLAPVDDVPPVGGTKPYEPEQPYQVDTSYSNEQPYVQPVESQTNYASEQPYTPPTETQQTYTQEQPYTPPVDVAPVTPNQAPYSPAPNPYVQPGSGGINAYGAPDMTDPYGMNGMGAQAPAPTSYDTRPQTASPYVETPVETPMGTPNENYIATPEYTQTDQYGVPPAQTQAPSVSDDVIKVEEMPGEADSAEKEEVIPTPRPTVISYGLDAYEPISQPKPLHPAAGGQNFGTETKNEQARNVESADETREETSVTPNEEDISDIGENNDIVIPGDEVEEQDSLRRAEDLDEEGKREIRAPDEGIESTENDEIVTDDSTAFSEETDAGDNSGFDDDDTTNSGDAEARMGQDEKLETDRKFGFDQDEKPESREEDKAIALKEEPVGLSEKSNSENKPQADTEDTPKANSEDKGESKDKPSLLLPQGKTLPKALPGSRPNLPSKLPSKLRDALLNTNKPNTPKNNEDK